MLKLLGLGARLGVCGGAVFLMHDSGALGDLKQGEAAYKRFKSLTLEEVIGKDLAGQIPSVQVPEEVESGVKTATSTVSDVKKENENFWSYWNCGVRTTFTAINNLPETGSYYANLAVEEIKNNMK